MSARQLEFIGFEQAEIILLSADFVKPADVWMAVYYERRR